MNSVDMIIIVVALLFGALGIYWGFIRQVLALAGLIAGIVFASRYGADVADALSSFIANDMLARVLGFIVVLVGVSSAASLLASLLRRFVGLLFLGWLDHLLGGLLGVLQGLMACAVLLLVAAASPLSPWALALADSSLAPLLVRIFSFLLPLLPDSFRFAAQLTFGIP
jgi:membrane protein required for colicin V production